MSSSTWRTRISRAPWPNCDASSPTDGEVLLSLPNLAHLQSRLNFLVAGRLIRTASELKHPGDRPIGEYLRLADRAGFELVARSGINPTFPFVTHWIRQAPRLSGVAAQPPDPAGAVCRDGVS